MCLRVSQRTLRRFHERDTQSVYEEFDLGGRDTIWGIGLRLERHVSGDGNILRESLDAERELPPSRLSDHRFLANFFRLYLHAAALNLLVLSAPRDHENADAAIAGQLR